MYELRVTLLGVRPPVWRVFQVPHRTTLHRLHQILQTVMGWEDEHLYLFHGGNVEFGDPAAQWDEMGMGTRNATKTLVEDVLGPDNKSITYVYDMGDGWTHRISYVRTLQTEGREVPRCLRGKGACPPEDCGGPYGYANLLEVLADPSHEDHEEMMEWIGGPFDPVGFDLAAVNKELSRLARPRSRKGKRA